MPARFSTLAVTDLSRLIAVRYLGGILELPTFWNHRLAKDIQSLSHVLCKLSIHVLEDLGTNCDTREAVLVNDLVTLDLQGIHIMLFAVVNRFPSLLKADEGQLSPSLGSAKKLVELLQRQVGFP